MKNQTLRVLAGVGATVALVLAAPIAASAHVTIDPDESTAGGYDTVNVRVPNESDTASTVGIEVALPTDTPLLYVGYQQVPGWSIEVTTETLPEPVEVEGTEVTEAPVRVTFTAEAGGIAPGQFQEFPLVLGPMPSNVDQLVLPAVQTYDDGEVVEWTATPDEIAADESLLPAPVITLAAAPAGGDGHDHGDTASSDASAVGSDGATPSSGTSDGAALGLGISGLVVGTVGAVIAVVALLRTRRTA